MSSRLVLSLFALPFLMGLALAADPKVPAAKDPGVTPVALAATGIDYTDTSLASRLARDGEGNIVGWDFVDNDIFPYAKDERSNAYARLLLVGPDVELVPLRLAADDFAGAARATAFVSRTQARTLVLTLSSTRKEDWDLFTKAAAHFKDLLIIVPAGETAPLYPAALKLDNVLSVALPSGKLETADVAMAVPEASSPSATNVEAAIVLAAALATCHRQIVGDGDSKARKAAVLTELAKPRSVSRVPAVATCN